VGKIETIPFEVKYLRTTGNIIFSRFWRWSFKVDGLIPSAKRMRLTSASVSILLITGGCSKTSPSISGSDTDRLTQNVTRSDEGVNPTYVESPLDNSKSTSGGQEITSDYEIPQLIGAEPQVSASIPTDSTIRLKAVDKHLSPERKNDTDQRAEIHIHSTDEPLLHDD